MTTEHTERPTFAVEGSATIKHLNVRKEGPEDNKVLAVDIKLEFRRIPRQPPNLRVQNRIRRVREVGREGHAYVSFPFLSSNK